MTRKEFQLSGDDVADARRFMTELLRGDIKATRLIETTAPAGTVDVEQEIFVPDPKGPLEIDNGAGIKIRVRSERRTVTVPRRALVKLEYDEAAPVAAKETAR